MNSFPAKDLMQVDSVLMHVEDLCRRYEELTSHPLAEDVKVSVIMDIGPKQLKKHLELLCREENDQRVRAEIVQHTQRRKNQSQEQLVAMDIGSMTMQTKREWDYCHPLVPHSTIHRDVTDATGSAHVCIQFLRCRLSRGV